MKILHLIISGVTGRVQTFNFPGQVALEQQRYSSCIRQEDGYCGIQWSATQNLPAGQDNFALSAAAAAIAVNGNALPNVGIPGSRFENYGGGTFGTAADTTSGTVVASGERFMLNFYSTAGDADVKGYDLTWQQLPCSGVGGLDID